ncbi:hypothetical protein THAOC_35246, partial [Thalassiosira oceanica]
PFRCKRRNDLALLLELDLDRGVPLSPPEQIDKQSMVLWLVRPKRRVLPTGHAFQPLRNPAIVIPSNSLLLAQDAPMAKPKNMKVRSVKREEPKRRRSLFAIASAEVAGWLAGYARSKGAAAGVGPINFPLTVKKLCPSLGPLGFWSAS